MICLNDSVISLKFVLCFENLSVLKKNVIIYNVYVFI